VVHARRWSLCLNEEQPIAVYWGPNSFYHCLACGNECDPQWTRYRIFFVQTSSLPPSMHKKFTEHGRYLVKGWLRKVVGYVAEAIFSGIRIKKYSPRSLGMWWTDKVFRRLHFSLTKEDIEAVASCEPQMVERILKLLKYKVLCNLSLWINLLPSTPSITTLNGPVCVGGKWMCHANCVVRVEIMWAKDPGLSTSLPADFWPTPWVIVEGQK
jgi:hypothetical protein